ncbi:hypothetical protein A1O3_08878 [Capronia epimyces CBS 606.96]|uniref:amidase n=1 Tax=Capronia epimyces CBS 606.96 TaxID=1182542 RepID=W9XQZ7_9EURO|nr:uncharacterized protein A1O3_08878 [Capronia epimyces CBS 606.96]EXJ79376.1 hypothetical protein A1O3_08878 [Capronia epimyces CBS 606.96]
MGSITGDWRLKAARGKKIQQESIPKQWILAPERLPPTSQLCVIDVPKESGLLSEKELIITESTATSLVDKMASGTWTAEEVTIAFLKRATLGQQLLNFATEFLAEEAIARAKELDRIFHETGKIVGPLHGVPVSVKEHIGIKGRVCNAGYVSWMDYISPDDAVVVQLLQKAGGIVIVRTNEPQSLMAWLESDNNITGRTLNPHNRNLTPGGSSGGEGASMGFKCACLGVGSDIGGSIRGPAAFNGVYGLRPTAHRLPLVGLRAAGMGQDFIHGVVGPLGHSVEDLELFMKSLLDQCPWKEDMSLVPVPWRTAGPPATASLTVGIMKDNGLVHPHPPITRALELAEKKLIAAGVRVVEWKPYQYQESSDLTAQFYFADGGKAQRSALADEPLLPQTTLALAMGSPGGLDVSTSWDLNYQKEVIRAMHHAEWQRAGVDFVLSPAYVGVAPEHGTAQYFFYTALWNVLEQPAVVFPTGLQVDAKIDVADASYQPRSELDAREYAKYSPEKFDKVPISLQLAGKRWHDEELLAGAKVVQGIIAR